MKFTTTSQAIQYAGVKVLCYARAGMGKTVLCATAPKPLIISVESGLLSLSNSNLVQLFGENNPNICYDTPVVEIKNLQDLLDVYNWCAKSKEANYIETVCLDSLTEIAEVVLDAAKLKVKDGRQAYLQLTEKMRDVIKCFRDIKGKHVFMTAKEEKIKDEFTGMMLSGPSMPGGKLSNQLPYFFDEVFNLNIEKDVSSGKTYRYLRTSPNHQYECKDRSGRLAEIEMPDLTHVFNKILNKGNN